MFCHVLKNAFLKKQNLLTIFQNVIIHAIHVSLPQGMHIIYLLLALRHARMDLLLALVILKVVFIPIYSCVLAGRALV